ncbi:hypothetical protein IAT38_002967 [Cryptococcus sp. DSM 104549]
MPVSKEDEAAFDSLPAFDPDAFQPPEWAAANAAKFQWKRNGESSKAAANNAAGPEGDEANVKHAGKDEQPDGDIDAETDEEDEDFHDAQSVIDPEEAMFTPAELRDLLARATEHKATGNAHFTAKPPRYDDAIKSYQLALDHLPSFLRDDDDGEGDSAAVKGKGPAKPAAPAPSGLQEVTDEEAQQIEADANKPPPSPEAVERRGAEDAIRECNKACWGNMAACHIALKEDDKAVKACTEALKIDKHYEKGLHRRATANERLGGLAALSQSLEDYTLLSRLLPASSPLLPPIRRSLAALPPRIKIEEKAQYDEMMGKLKELGNSFLSNFGLSTDSFKFEQQPGGGYNMQFNR